MRCEKVRATGDATLALKLGIPRIRLPKPHVDYDGSLTFADNEIAYVRTCRRCRT